MSNIEVPEDIQDTVQLILRGREFQMNTTVVLAEFIHGLYKPEIVVEDFVVYKIQVRGDDEPRMGFRVNRNAPYPWVTLNSNSPNKERAFAVTNDNLIHSTEEVRVIERWTPEAPEIEFGLPADEEPLGGRDVLIRGKLISQREDAEGDVYVRLNSSYHDNDHYVRVEDVAYDKENRGN